VAAAVFMAAISLPVTAQYWNSCNCESTTDKKTDVSPVHLVERIPDRYRERYNRWKTMLRSVESGRQLWTKYAENPAFRLTIVVSKSKKQGANVNNYQWENRKLVGITINLGSQLDYGIPGDVLYYPVLGSLGSVKEDWVNNGSDILAAAKFAHEFGHIEHADQTDGAVFQLQNDLSQIFTDRFLKNGHNAADPVLAELAGRMGGIPTQIKLERENWAETYALRYLMDKLETKKIPVLLKQVRQSIQSKFGLYSPPLRASWSNLTSYAGELASSDRYK
jgi:hypothetical protein